MGSSPEQTIAIGLFAVHIKETVFTRSKWHYQLWLSLLYSGLDLGSYISLLLKYLEPFNLED
ncbi:LOW QUALITY PROTEIN: hypothetical protein TorRG33x02_288170 [Trema orientale]|uniref:Uncharacterized protein n=1 Tax=Trema orientale TaxID=63057 RepID=A0A2P5CER4_TREOI|nr:LOW QUALITY PROTEIN: hypothetical protein TorRG33x02_288170 [Trema orientale]